MGEQKKQIQFEMIAGVLFALMALVQLSRVISYFSIWSLLTFAAYVAISAGLFMKRRNLIIVAGFGVLALLGLISFFKGFPQGAYTVRIWSYYSDDEIKFNLFCMLPALCSLIGEISMFAVSVIGLTDYLPAYKKQLEHLWFVPAACGLAAYIFAVIVRIACAIGLIHGYWMWAGAYLSLVSLLNGIIYLAGVLLAALWIAFLDGFPQKTYSFNRGNANTHAETNTSTSTAVAYSDDEAYCGIAKHTLLLLFTFGIWMYIWIYRMTGFLNKVEDEEPRNPTTKLLLCIFVPFYNIYWTYKSAQRIDKLAKSNGVESDLSTLCLILAIFVGIIPPILMQDKINAIVSRKSNAGVSRAEAPVKVAVEEVSVKETPVREEPANGVQTASFNVVEELKQYKELLDCGILTQEEFDAKKKQLLGL